MRAIPLIAGIGIGVVITPPIAMVAIGSGGAGHGHYEFARLLFPYTMLLTLLAHNRITLPLMVLALAQFPIYGAIIGFCSPKLWVGLIVGGIIFIGHAIAAAFCFSGVIPNFS